MKIQHLFNLSFILLAVPLSAQEKSSGSVDPEIASFDDLALEAEDYWNGSDGSGGFVSGPAFFCNSYNPDWFSWSGWAYSNVTDNATPGWGNQYSAITGEGRSSESGSNYGVSFASPPSGIIFNDGSAHEVSGFYVTNATYAALSMRDGDDFAKKFGGDDGTDEDWCKLTVIGYIRGDSASSAAIYLADYTSANPEEDYIIQDWEWFDLSGLGKIDSLSFSMSSTDNGDWGMNTPAYFAMDDLTVLPDIAPTVDVPMEDINDLSGKQLELDISDVFTDEDDDNAKIVISLKSNTDEAVAMAVLDGMDLSLDLLSEGSTTLTLEAVSNNKSVEETMVVSVTATGIEQRQKDSYVAYPNPTDGLLRIVSVNTSSVDVSLYDPSGRRLDHHPEYTPGTALDISEYPAGTYILKIESGTEVKRRTIVKL
jgi:hypothetical protein